jgi:hypothetical protein
MRVLALSVANEQIEIVRNLPYSDVGTTNGIPNGKVLATTTVSRGNVDFLVETTIRNVDDPFDGQIGSSTNDTAPADYKFMQVDVSVPDSNRDFKTLNLVTYIAPKNLENSSTNGALLVRVIDAGGNPVSDAKVQVVNNSVSPAINIVDVTNNEGKLDIIDVPPSNNYHIEVSKPGYSSDRTYVVSIANPVPSKPDSVVAIQMATTITFAIDKLSELNVKTYTPTCDVSSNIAFTIAGSKQIGDSPVVLKYPETALSTNFSGIKEISDLEWDSYIVAPSSTSQDLIDSDFVSPVTVLPNIPKDIKLVVAPKNTGTLLFRVVDQFGVPVDDAVVTLTKGLFTATSTSNSICLSPGKVTFTGLSDGSYSANISKVGYTDQNISVGMMGAFITQNITLSI